MKEFPIIGFAGAAGAGKDTAANHLCLRYEFSRLSFAEPLKAAIKEMLSDSTLFNREKKEEWIEGFDPSITPRHLAQTLGTEWGREILYPDFWVDLWKIRLERARTFGFKGVAVPDVRFANEVAAIRELGGKVFTIQGRSLPVNHHKSEAQILGTDATLYNTTSIEILHQQLDWWLDQWYDGDFAGSVM